jgi:hypothetical protein
MKVSNNQKPTKGDDGVSRETLNDWQRKDAKRQSQETKAENDQKPVKT